MAKKKSDQLGAALIAQGYLSQDKLSEALSEQKRTGRMLGQILVDNQYVSEEQLAKVIAAQLSIPFIDLRHFNINPESVHLLTELQARQFDALVLKEQGDSYMVGLVDPFNLRAQDELSHLLKRPIHISLITNDQFNKTIDRVYRKTDKLDEYASEVKQEIESRSIDLNLMDSTGNDIYAPVIKLLQTMFEEATELHASDIHIEPEEKKLAVRFRIDGVLHRQIEADSSISAALVVRLKLLAGLDIAEKRLPMDGRLSVKIGSKVVEVRLSTIPTPYGESVVMRLLYQSDGPVSLDKAGMPPDLIRDFTKIIKLPHGIVLATGPTGCGKTTTLYAALEILNQSSVKILTCEDPIEYRLAGISQVQVNEKIDLTFSRMLRAFLRQDPDIILVGEIRDIETAQIAIRAAMTGHLVLSTLHTNDAVSTPGRLLDMGIPGYLIATALRGVLAQRLLRVNCSYCSEPYHPDHDEMEWVRHFPDIDLAHANFHHGKGCDRCNGSGFGGRTGVYELLEMTPPLSAAIHSGDSVFFERVARESLGKGSIEHRTLKLVLDGKTTVAEAMNVAMSVET